MSQLARILESIVGSATQLRAISKAQLQFGDCLLVATRNSVYSIRVFEDDSYQVRGGWFDHERLSPMRIGINGCTWGGCVIKSDIVAACGLRLEFANSVVTTAIQKIWLLRYGSRN